MLLLMVVVLFFCSRIEFYSKFFTSMTSVETKFHEEMAKVCAHNVQQIIT